jgi:hypothetical protein
MMRKKRVLLLLMAGVACLIGVIIGAEYNSPLIYIPFKICIGEGGVLRRVGKVVAHDCDDEIEYSAYVGNARCFSGERMQGILLIPERLPEDTVKRCAWYPWKQLLVDRNRLSHGAMDYLRLPFGYLPTTGIGGIDVTSGKGFSGKLTIEEVGDSRMYKFEYNYPSKKDKEQRSFYLEIPKAWFDLIPGEEDSELPRPQSASPTRH